VGQRDHGVHGHGPLLVVMGDSMTSPYSGHMFPWQAWPRYVGRHGYRTVNLGVGESSTAHMCGRIDQFVREGTPDIAVVFAGHVDAERGIENAEIERNVTFMLDWLAERRVRKIVLMGPATLNLPRVPPYLQQHVPDWFAEIDRVRQVLRDLAAKHDVLFIDVAQLLRDRIARGEDLDFTRVPYKASRSWHACTQDGHFNAYGQRLIADAFLSATPHWRPAPPRRGPLPLLGRWRTRPQAIRTDVR
jgi:lysophospholipase L1-like esterase